MRFFSTVTMILMMLVLAEAFKASLKKGGLKKKSGLRKGGGHVLKVIGETGLGVVSLSAAIAILNSLEAETDPTDEDMMALIGAERERLMSLNSSSWNSPIAWGGSTAGISALVIFIFLIRLIRNRKQDGKKKTTIVLGAAVKEQDGLQFGEVNMRNLEA